MEEQLCGLRGLLGKGKDHLSLNLPLQGPSALSAPEGLLGLPSTQAQGPEPGPPRVWRWGQAGLFGLGQRQLLSRVFRGTEAQ